ncbi:thiolase family protein [Rhodococcus sp. MS16]|nr:thiolase family protein [Rhodococcus globerulus]NRI68721.1 thiolase family protein [Rhodococcus sp. MS16]
MAGVGESEYSRRSDPSVTDLSLAVDAAIAAIADAGLTTSEVDGVVAPYMGPDTEELIVNLGLSGVTYSSQIRLGGASPVAAVGYAAAAVAAGQAEVVIVPVGWAGYSGQKARDLASVDLSTPYRRAVHERYAPNGATSPMQVYAQMARRHMYEFGTSVEALGRIAVNTRANALLHPKAVMSKPMTLDDYLNSKLIVDPYRLFDCCLDTDAGAAVVVTSLERAKALAARHGRTSVVIDGCAEARPTDPTDMFNRSDFFEIGLTRAAPRAWEMAGLGPEDMSFAQVYDCFTFEVLQQLEEAGFCGRGEADAFVLGGATDRGGHVPVNTHGGLLSQAHALGMNHVVEAVVQLRGEAEARQVDSARHGAVTGWGDLGDGSLLVLSGTESR